MHVVYRVDEKKKLYFGKVTEVRDAKNDAKCIVLDGTLSVFFHGDKASRVEKAMVHEGSWLTILAYSDDDTTANGIDFRFRGKWTFRDENDKTKNVLVGVACRPRSPQDGRFAITVPVDVYNNGQTETLWVSAMFFDSDDGTHKTASNVKRSLANMEKPLVVVVGGELTNREANGKTYTNMTGYRCYVAK